MLADAVLLRGPVGVGKSTAAWALNDLLIAADVPHAALDLDWLAAAWPHFGQWNDETRYLNTATIAANYRAMGIRYFVAAGVIETREGVERLRVALGAQRLAVCRLRTSLGVIDARLRAREPDDNVDRFLERAAVLDAQLAADGLDDLVLDASQPPRAIAQQLIDALGWIGSERTT